MPRASQSFRSHRRRWLRAFGLCAVTAGCGENVDFASARSSDAGIETASADVAAELYEGGKAEDAALNGRCAPDAGPLVACRPNGSTCRAMRDCCSGRCDNGYCLQTGTCNAPGAPCNTRTGCCSGRCEPVGRSGALACAQFCVADGARCMQASDCCSLACNAGVCGGPLCSTAGTSCGRDTACCSGRCSGGRCVTPPGACLPTGEGCTDPDVDGGSTGSTSQCCSHACNARTGRCDLGPGNCRESSTPCNVDGECCFGSCSRNAQGFDVCTAPCFADGENCNSNGDCCDGVCGGALSTCLSPMEEKCP